MKILKIIWYRRLTNENQEAKNAANGQNGVSVSFCSKSSYGFRRFV